MRKTIYMMIAAAAITGMASCEKESAFDFTQEEGMIDCGNLNVDYINSETATRAGNIDKGNFTVKFINSSGETEKQYLYSSMPQIVSLPVGKYSVVADYGTNPTQGFEAPYYRGEIEEIEIKANQISQPQGTVTCKLSNIKILVKIQEMANSITGNANSILGSDVKVTVKVGSEGELAFFRGETRAGYFKYVDGSSTITATFSGTVDNNQVNETKSFSNAAPGNFYTINFTVAKPDSDDPNSGTIGGGNGSGGITIDATIESQDVTVPTAGVDNPHEDVIEGGRNGGNN